MCRQDFNLKCRIKLTMIFYYCCDKIRLGFLGAEACLLAGSARNAYHTKYQGYFTKHDLSCATLRKGVFAAGAALTLFSMLASILYYWAHCKADTGFWEKHQNEGIGLATHNHGPESDKP